MENWLDIKNFTTKGIISIVELTTTWIEVFDLGISGTVHTRRQKSIRLAQKCVKYNIETLCNELNDADLSEQS